MCFKANREGDKRGIPQAALRVYLSNTGMPMNGHRK